MLSLIRASASRKPLSLSLCFLSKHNFQLKTFPTPNENALKFVPDDKKIHFLENSPSKQTVEFNSALQATHSPLALKIFDIKGVRSIMIGDEFITVNKNDAFNWMDIKIDIAEEIINHIKHLQQPVVDVKHYEQTAAENTTKFGIKEAKTEEEEEIVAMIEELIETRIRPAIQDDGGDVEFRGFNFDNGTVYLKLQGACKTCSSSEDTLKNGIESMLMHYIDEVQNVEQILDPEEIIAIKEFEKLELQLSSKKSQPVEDDIPPAM
ncbi:hypothetical protein BABINDRAFT_6350 [Babjeviella inositovora NRRL Y-12698]|uniref:Scaffold protein Nfu/NifU N-terminal domain-containing protein n=1 Tax=Babjeviella inositovora NRRL Y-12698 TaxID=984486 RepID=A0A1E3QVN6_9ASCO|nr:uncharacterized protein BABINDRAFT_6350 [Babjeviella inositovora NRRL Y-12698]ODQ81684.1 hypothetical protein BABINDRAFT_6350 [Babjeviella inositovora NRRL Y-12698]